MWNLKNLVALLIVLFFVSPVMAETVATGPMDGYYNNGMFSLFAEKLSRTSRGELELERVDENGTEGTIDNLKRVDAGEADFAFVQKGGTALKDYPNVKVIGVISYELAHFVYPKGSNATSCDAIESSKSYKIGVGYLSGSKVTTDVMAKVDKDYSKASWTDTIDGVDALMKFEEGAIDGYFFVSMPNTTSIQRFVQAGYKFGDCWDADFDEFEVNNKQLYTKVKVGKDNQYPNTFKTFTVPNVLVANKTWLKENRQHLPAIMDAVTMTKEAIKSVKGLKYYPED